MPKPKYPNLTRAGKGRPSKGLKEVRVALTPQLLAALAQLQSRKGWARNYAIEEILRWALGLPSHYGEGMHELLEDPQDE